MRSRAHLTDLMSALEWLPDEELRIDLDAYPGVPRRELMQLLCKFYTAHRQARPHMAAALAFNDKKGCPFPFPCGIHSFCPNHLVTMTGPYRKSPNNHIGRLCAEPKTAIV